jgi:hypothetical protein
VTPALAPLPVLLRDVDVVDRSFGVFSSIPSGSANAVRGTQISCTPTRSAR